MAPDPSPPSDSHQQNVTSPASLYDIFRLFLDIGALSFGGGVTAWCYREAVDKRRWLSPTDFMSGLTLSQVLPGINMSNLAIYLGQRLRGPIGAVTAIFALLLVPFFFNIGLYSIYDYIKGYNVTHLLFDGVAVSAVGLFLSVSIKSAPLAAKTWIHGVVIACLIVCVGILKWPMVPVVLVLAPISVWAAWSASPPTEEPEAP
jgi:chromate transporter